MSSDTAGDVSMAAAGDVAPAGEVALADGLLDALGLLRRQVRRFTGRPFPNGDLTGSHGELMRTVRQRPGVSIAEAAAELGLAANTVSTLVAHLVGQGLLTRTPDPADRRVGRLELTEPARQRVGQWREHRTGLTARALARLDAADRDALAATLPALARLAELIRAEPDRPGPYRPGLYRQGLYRQGLYRQEPGRQEPGRQEHEESR